MLAQVLFTVLACAPTRALAPLQAGQSALTASIGGPIVEVYGAPLPLPISSIGYVRGLDGKTNGHATVYPTNLALFGVFGFDLGVSRELVMPGGARPRVMADLTEYTFFGNAAEGDPKGGFRTFPDVSFIASWPIGPEDHARTVPYVGIDQFVQPFPSFRWVPSLVVGDELRIGRHFGLQLETKWMAPLSDTDPVVPHWYGLANHGAFSVQIGFNIYPGPKGAP